ncbi:cupin domain-containing protein [Oscillatoria sp. CS-180]|uniref:cupin domain-containing protein n=1 Tax=Oscillatoria sp. CS-180 TaxID=3021720 RepID=UPI00232B8C72|nr:cupin domain-containing protein [Oscillatoria sp. CS-180]MDB9528319.1 cupin domain-containing protein [Oscillatoria sp. CS-180]
MQGQDWMASDDGQVRACTPPRDWTLLETPYHFHRFLTQVEDVLKETAHEDDCLSAIRHLVRKLALNSYWLQMQHPELSTLDDIAVQTLYDEIGYPLTVQTNTYPPGVASPVHNHGTWGVVTLLKGQEKNTFWQHTPTPEFKDKVMPVEEKVLRPGDVISFSPGAIHCVKAVGDTPLVTFNIYGETHSKARFEFDIKTHQAKNF